MSGTTFYSAGTFVLTGFDSSTNQSGAYDASYHVGSTTNFFYQDAEPGFMDPTGGTTDYGSFDFNYSDTTANGSAQVVSVGANNDAWSIGVTISALPGDTNEFLQYGNNEDGTGFSAASNTPGGDTLYFSGTGAANLQTLIQGLYVASGASGPNQTFGITFDLVDGSDAGQSALTGTNQTNEAEFTTYFVACYAVGSAIAVPAGELPIEDLRIGDLVMTASGIPQPIKWIGRRSYTAAQIAANSQLRPVLIRRGALAQNMPHRDLVVSPMHSMFIDDAFIPAAALVNNVSILRIDALEPVSYIHIELADHGTVFAEGAPAETFVDDNSRMMFDNADEYYDMFGAEVSSGFSAPRLEEGYQLAAIRRRLELRAGATPAPVTAGPMQGHVERMADSVVEGWVFDQTGRAPVELEVLVDGELFATVLANRYRMDLDHAGLAGGSCGFSIAMPASVINLSQVEIRRAVDGSALAMPKVAAFAA